jgi:hypothetical protein
MQILDKWASYSMFYVVFGPNPNFDLDQGRSYVEALHSINILDLRKYLGLVWY